MDKFYPKDMLPETISREYPTKEQFDRMEALIKKWKKPVEVRDAVDLIEADQPHTFTITEMTDALIRVQAELNPPVVEVPDVEPELPLNPGE